MKEPSSPAGHRLETKGRGNQTSMISALPDPGGVAAGGDVCDDGVTSPGAGVTGG